MTRLERAKQFFSRQMAVGKVIAKGEGIDIDVTPSDINDALSNIPVGEIKNGDTFMAGKRAIKGITVIYEGKSYICLQSHITMAEWSPIIAPALWILEKSEGDKWIQPQGAHDAYSIGEIVSHKEKLWKSIVDKNVWEPSVYGWEEV